MPLVQVDSLADPRLAGYAALREKDLARRDGLFVVEGEVVVRVLLATRRFEVASLLLAEGREAKLAEPLAAWGEFPVYVAPQRLMDGLVGFPIHRGVLALAKRGAAASADALLGSISVGSMSVVVAVGIANHDNVGGIFRNAAAFGAGAVLLDAASCDPLYRKATRVSVGGTLVVPFARGGDAFSLLGALAARRFDAVALSPHGAEDLRNIEWPARTALVVGAEGGGLPDALLDRVRTARISMAPGFDSLNVAQAVGIALFARGGPAGFR